LGGVQIGKKFCDVILVTFLGDVMVMTSLKWRHNFGKKICDVILVMFLGDVMVITSLKW